MPRIIESKENLTRMREEESIKYFGSLLYTELERAYGKYLLVPYDLPKILPYDMEKFVDFYFKHAKFSIKIKEDIASGFLGDRPPGRTPYLSLDSCPSTDTTIWEKNYVPEMYTEFPELFEQIHDYMPFLEKGFMWKMWSSVKDIIPHRDVRTMIDLPMRLRIKLYDDNPSETLSLELAPIDKPIVGPWPIDVPEDTNSFAWNNLRTRHRSVFNQGHKKILFIAFSNYTGKGLNQYIDLLDRSISKYQDRLLIDKYTDISDYINGA